MYKYIIIWLLFFLCFEKIYANHVVGADLTYRCLGPGSTPGSLQYELTYSFYRDCSGLVTPPNPLDIQVTNGCGFTNPIVNLPLLDTSEITSLCPTSVSVCNGGIYTGVQEWIFRGTVTLPGYCSDWTFSHSEGVRNVAITTFVSGSVYSLYVFTRVNNLGGLCNSSPTFSNKPVPFACDSQRFCFNHGANDVDGDSLSYEIITPRVGPYEGDTVDYALGYSATQPVISNPPMSFNSVTGDFCMNPIQQDITVLAILVNEYRNGILIGQIERDMEIIVQACSNRIPLLTGINALPIYHANFCIDQVNCFYVRSLDADIANTTTISWDHSIPNATLTNSGGHRDSAVFCWTPTIADTSASPYCITLSVTDDNCPYYGTYTYAYCITVDTSLSCHPFNGVPINTSYFDLKIYPQPASDHLLIEFGNEFNLKKNYHLRIDNILGETVYQSSISDEKFSIDISQWSSTGIHFVYLVDENNRIVQAEKIITIK